MTVNPLQWVYENPHPVALIPIPFHIIIGGTNFVHTATILFRNDVPELCYNGYSSTSRKHISHFIKILEFNTAIKIFLVVDISKHGGKYVSIFDISKVQHYNSF